MPCYTRTSVTVNLGNVNRERLESAALLVDMRVFFLANGDVEITDMSGYGRDRAVLERELKQQYTKLTVEAAAKRFNFNVKTAVKLPSLKVKGAQVVQMKLGR